MLEIKDSVIFAAAQRFHQNTIDVKTAEQKRGEHLIQPVMNVLEKEKIIGIELLIDFSFQSQQRNGTAHSKKRDDRDCPVLFNEEDFFSRRRSLHGLCRRRVGQRLDQEKSLSRRASLPD